MNKIVQLKKEDMPELINLFVACFHDDKYYSKMYSDPLIRDAAMRESFYDCLEYCVDTGGAFAVKNDDKLIAFVVSFNYHEAKTQNKKVFNKIFSGDSESDDFPYKEQIHNRIEGIDGDVIYLLSIGVEKELRRCGMASSLIDFVLKKHETSYIVGDVSNSNSLVIYKKRDFLITDIDYDYYFVQHCPISKGE